MATRLIGTDTVNPRLPAVVIAATQGTTAADLAPGDVLADANAYTDAAIADVVVGGVAFASDAETIEGTATDKAVNPAGLNAAALMADHAINSHITPEPGAVVCWTADDGYTKQVDYFNLLNTKGINGTLFLTKNWVDQVGTHPSWSDTYITTAQVQAIVAAGHELASHGVAHEDVTAYYAANGAAGLEAMEQEVVDYIESTYGVTVSTGAYPAGLSNERTREVVARNHRFFRGTKGVTVLGAPDPFDIPAIDVQNLTEAAIKAHVDFAVANRNLCVFLVHGGMTADKFTTYGNVMNYIASLGVPQKRFDEAILERTAWRGSAGAMIDTQGNARFLDTRSTRVEVHRQDMLAGKAWWDINETTNVAEFDSDASVIEFAGTLRPRVGFEHGRKLVIGDGVLNSTTTLTSSSAGFDQRDVGITVTGTGIPGGTTIATVNGTTSVIMSAAATATASNVVVTLGRQNLTGSFRVHAPDPKIYGNLDLYGSQGRAVQFFLLESTLQGSISATQWSRAGSGGGMIIDSGTGGSNIDYKGYGHRFWNHAGARKINLSTGVLPLDANIANGEVAIFFDSTNGASKMVFKGKSNDGTIVNANIPMT